MRQRVQRMLDSGVMQIVAVTDPLTLGFARQVMIGMKVDGDMRDGGRKHSRRSPRSTTWSSAPAATTCSPSWSAPTTITCSHLLNEQIRTIPGVRSTETFVYLKLAKQTYAWGTR